MSQLSLLSGLDSNQYKILYFDLETKKSAEEVGGWSNIKDMGMACGVLYDSEDDLYHVYLEDQVHEMIKHIKSADLIVGFNHIYFDYKVLTAYDNFNYNRLNNFDLLLDIEMLLGRRLKLDALAKTTLKKQKTADGLQSLQWVKEGKIDQVIDYCKADVEVTKDLFLFGVENNFILYPDRGQKAQLNVNWNIDKLVK
ncbi:MAG TPA: DEAD/DEAH box helicase [Oligoflexia bacterium]|nr:DEAD/DEAH box helicase [Oligoflexia bacterium]HMR23874.1 DEAD/DEAH box helicase [Oligoflexia bacterium]